MARKLNLGRWQWLGAAAALAAVVGYLLLTWSAGLQGFPLDDAWIHQTYARTLAETGQLAYGASGASAGSTSPAWTFLLSVGYLLGIDFHLWTYLLGALSLAAGAWLVYRLSLHLSPSPSRPWLQAALLAGLFCAVEWHLVWAAASGMETALFVALSLWLLDRFFAQIAARRAGPDGPTSLARQDAVVAAVGLGLLGGVLVLTRPEGLGLAGLVLAGGILLPWPPRREALGQRAVEAAVATGALALLLAPYVAFNLRASGTLWPNTLYAKQLEYGLDSSLPARLWRVLSPTLVGAQVLLVPGAIYGVYRLVRRQRWATLVPAAWWLGFVTLYALRLPVNYQHGRYLMPTIPILPLYGVWGTAALLRPRDRRLPVRVASRAAPVAIAILALLFWARGAVAYRTDVAIIEGEMVDTARWLARNTPADVVVAVHDIGAVGYLSGRRLLDLAGLISPEVIPFMTDADRLADWMVGEGADYAVFFPDFSPTYQRLAADPRFDPVYCTDHAGTREQGRANMCVYRVVPGQ